MIRSALTVIALGLPAAAGAQGVPVRSAEHDGFTRIVVDFGRLPDWRITPGDDVLTLQTETDLSFDLSDVYRRISDVRVDSVVQRAAGTLDILLNCDCSADTMELRNQGLVIDIRPGEQTPPGIAEGRPGSRPLVDLPLPDGLLPGLLTRTARTAWPYTSGRMGDKTPKATTDRVSELEPRREPEREPALAPVSAELPRDRDDGSNRVGQLRREIVEAMGRSAEQGLIDLVRDLPEDQRAAASEPVAREPVLPMLDPGSNILIETQVQKDRRGYATLPSTSACPDGLAGGKEDWLARIEPVEIDATPLEIARADAVPLIVEGFGAEARTLIEPYRDVADMAILHQLAGLADNGIPAPLVESVAECGPLLSLFALIAEPPLEPSRIEPVVQALGGLEPALQAQFGRRAISSLEALGQRENAKIVRNAVLRQVPGLEEDDLAPRNYGPGGVMPTEADAIRELTGRTPEAAGALRALIDSKRRRGEAVAISLIDQAAALLPELDAPERRRLSRSVIRAEIAQGGYQSAGRRIDDLARREPELASELGLSLYDALIAIGDDAVFLQQAARFAGKDVPTTEQRQALATRILALHVPRLALGFLEAGDTGTRDERILAAQIGVEMSAWDAAEIVLDGIVGADADALRSRIAAGRTPVVVAVENAPEPTGPGAESLSVIARSAALREKYQALLVSRD